MMLLLLHTSRLLWWSYSATFMCYEYSCMQYSFCNRMFVPEDVWNLAIFMNSCTCARQRVGIWLYSCIVGWTQVKHSWLCYRIFDNIHVKILSRVCGENCTQVCNFHEFYAHGTGIQILSWYLQSLHPKM